jgi:hypothetical protein
MDAKKAPQQKTQNADDFQEEYSEYPEDVTTYLSWHAYGRPYKKRSLEYYTNAFLIMLSVEIILFLFAQYVQMLVVFSLAFLAFALAVVPPHMAYYKVSDEGIRIEDYFYIWDELYDFYFMRHNGMDVLHIRTKAYMPGELTIVLGDMPVDQVKSILIHFLPYREYVKPTFTEKAGDWLEKNFPLERSTVK